MFNKSIAYRLSIYISLAVIAVFIAFITIFFLFNVKLIRENIQNKAVTISEDVKGEVNQYVKLSEEVADNIADQIIFYDQYESVHTFLDNLLVKYPFINAIHVNLDSTLELNNHNYFCYNEGDSIEYYAGNSPIQTCVTEQPEFKKLVQNRIQKWSEPLVCKRNQHLIVSYFSPVQISGENHERKDVGEVICELSLRELNKVISQTKIGEGGKAYLMSKQGTFISHPSEDWILEKSIFDVPFQETKFGHADRETFLNQTVAGSLIARPEMLDYKKSWIYYTQLDNDWILVLAIPMNEMFEPIYLPVLKMLFFSVLGILVIYILITYITNIQIQPLSELTNQLKRFSSLSGEIYSDEESMNEIKHVSESLNLLKNWYEKNKVKVSREERLNKLKDDDIYQAAEIQRSLIKDEYPAFPEHPELDIFASFKPARIVSGDLFDYFFRDEEHLVITIGDVSGKGVPAAFFMSVAQTVIKSEIVDSITLKSAALVELVNEELYSNNVHQFFLTLFLALFNIKTGVLSYCNAAHTASYILRANGKLDILVETHGLPLGLYREKGYHQGRTKLEKGDSLILYTDGVTELQDENKIQYGRRRFEENLMSLTNLSPKEMVTRIEKSLQHFLGDAPQNDDITILILRYDP